MASIISATELDAPQARTWQMHSLAHAVDPKKAAREREAYSELEKKLQPEINRQTEILKKEAYEEAKKDGFDAGYNEGKQLGQQEAKDIGLAEVEVELAEKLARLDELLTSLNSPYKLLEKEVFEQLSSLALHLAEEVIQQQVVGSSDWVMQIIHQAIEVLGDDLSPLVITLNPADFELISSLQTGFSENWSVKADERVDLGVCQITQGHSFIEHSWKRRLEGLSLKLQTTSDSGIDQATE